MYLFDALLYVCNFLVAYFPSRRIRKLFYTHIMQFDVARGVSIGAGLYVDCRRHLKIGENTSINPFCHLDNRGGIEIGSNVSMSPGVYLITADHDVQSPMLAGRQAPISIGDFVFIGAQAMILPGVSIGEGAVVAARAVVVRDVKPFTIVAGVPAKMVGERNSELAYTTKYHRHHW